VCRKLRDFMLTDDERFYHVFKCFFYFLMFFSGMIFVSVAENVHLQA